MKQKKGQAGMNRVMQRVHRRGWGDDLDALEFFFWKEYRDLVDRKPRKRKWKASK